MSEEQVVASPAADAGASPAAAPESSTPVASAPETSQETPVFTPPTKQEGEEDVAFLARARAEREAFDAKQAKPAEVKPVEAPKPEAEKPVEEPKTEEPKVEEKKDETAPEKVESALSLDELAPLPPQELTKILNENPDLAEKLDALGIKDQVFEGQRLAAQAVSFLDTFPGGIEDAKYAREQAENFGRLDEVYTSIKGGGIEALDNFVGALAEMDQLIGEDGKPVLDEQGNPVSQGYTQAFLSTIGDYTFNVRMNHLEKLAQEALKANPDDEEAQYDLAAVDRIKARTTGTAPEEDLTPAQKQAAEKLKADQDAFNQKQQADRDAQIQAREDKITETTDKTFDGEVLDALKKTDLRPEQHALVLSEIRQKVAEKLAHDPLFTSKRDWIMRAQWSPQLEQKRIAHNVNSMRAAFKTVSKEVFSRYGAKVISQQAERQTKINSQLAASKSEPRGAAGKATPPSTLTGAELKAKAVEELRKSNLDDSDERLILRKMTELRSRGM